ncbi:MAG: RNase adapter RapZ [Christensenellaceae bacterium]
MKFVIVTGLSGAGRSTALRRLEDIGYYCVDNLMPEFMPEFAKLCLKNLGSHAKIAVAADMRIGDLFDSIYGAIEQLKELDLTLDILFLDASDEMLVKRFKEVRRSHPLSNSGEILTGIQMERWKLQPIKEMSNHVVDTSSYNVMKLKRVIDDIYSSAEDNRMKVSIISFGYKRGIPLDADMVFDMRFLENPFWNETMRAHSGLDDDVRAFVLQSDVAQYFLDALVTMVTKLAPSFISEDKKQLVIGIGCTGGMHRSVAMAEELYNRLKQQNMKVSVEHRDLKIERTLQI